MVGNLHLAAVPAPFVDDAHRRLFHRDIQSSIMLHAALPFLMVVAVLLRPRSIISSKRSTSAVQPKMGRKPNTPSTLTRSPSRTQGSSLVTGVASASATMTI